MMKRLTGAVLLCGLLAMPALAQYTTAEEVLRANIEATGGMEAWEAATGVYQVTEITMEMGDNMMMMERQSWQMQSGYKLEMMTSEMFPGPIMTYITPEGGFSTSPMGREEFADTSKAVADAKRHFKEEIALLQDSDAPEMTLETGDFDGTPVYIVGIASDPPSKRFYDQETLLLLGIEITPPEGEPARLYIDDYRDVGGLQMPFFQSVDIMQQGMEMTQSMVMTEQEINPSITPEELEAKANSEGSN